MSSSNTNQNLSKSAKRKIPASPLIYPGFTKPFIEKTAGIDQLPTATFRNKKDGHNGWHFEKIWDHETLDRAYVFVPKEQLQLSIREKLMELMNPEDLYDIGRVLGTIPGQTYATINELAPQATSQNHPKLLIFPMVTNFNSNNLGNNYSVAVL